jgi:hypothetical protein
VITDEENQQTFINCNRSHALLCGGKRSSTSADSPRLIKPGRQINQKEKATMKAIQRIGMRTLAAVMMILLASLWAAAQTSGTPGKIAKFKSSTTLGYSVITEDKDGRVGIGTALPTSKLTVQGVIEALSGFKFPDGTVQTTSAAGALVSVVHDSTLQGNGTAASPLAVASPLLVRDLDNPARQPFQTMVEAPSGAPSGTLIPIVTVLAEKVLVLEFISGLINVPGNRFATAVLVIQEGGAPVFHHRLLLTKIGAASSTTDAYGVFPPFRMYVKSGQTISLAILDSDATITLNITGHYVDKLP